MKTQTPMTQKEKLMRRVEQLKGDLNAHRQNWTTFTSHEITEKKQEIIKLEEQIKLFQV